MGKKAKSVSVYQFYNFIKSTHGSPFGLCDKHRLTAPVPGECVLKKLGDNTELPCGFCLQETETETLSREAQ